MRNHMLELPQNRPEADLNNWQIWFVGHATVLIQIGPYNFLTDPVWCEYVSPKQGQGPQRACAPARARQTACGLERHKKWQLLP